MGKDFLNVNTVKNNVCGKKYYLLGGMIMWRDECGFKHNGPIQYEQRKLAEFRSRMTIEEKYKEKVEEACRWLNNFLYADSNTGNIRVHPLSYKSKKEIIDDFRNIMKLG